MPKEPSSLAGSAKATWECINVKGNKTQHLHQNLIQHDECAGSKPPHSRKSLTLDNLKAQNSAKLLEEDHDASRYLHEQVEVNGGHVHGQSVHDTTHRVFVKEPILRVQSWLLDAVGHPKSHRDGPSNQGLETLIWGLPLCCWLCKSSNVFVIPALIHFSGVEWCLKVLLTSFNSIFC
jgi:hypothetical protein